VRSGLAMVTLAAASWGTWSLFLRPTGLPATVTSPIMFAVMGLVTLPAALRLPPARWDRATLALLVANAAFDALNVLTFFGAMSTTTVAIAVLTHYLAPILVALLAPRIDGVATRGAGLAALVAVTGLAIVLEPWREAPPHTLLGATLGTCSAVCYAGNVFCVRRLAVRIGAARGMAYHSLLSAVALAPIAIGDLASGGVAVTPGALALLVAGSTTIGAASGVVFAIGLVRIGSARASILTFAEPLVAVAIGALVWHEPLSPLAIVGAALVLGAGIYVAANPGNHAQSASGHHRDAGS
jgi:DME family drug/metabolite transporter